MPKKFVGENSKAAAARARKEAVKETEKEKKKREEEEAKWRDDDKSVLKKQQRKEEQERKRVEQQQKKAEMKQLLEKEMTSAPKPAKVAPPPKVTRAQIENKVLKKEEKEKEKKIETHLDMPVVENINRLTIDGEEARSVMDAINILSEQSDPVDKHPEKRMKAAYTAYEERRLAELKAENPALRQSQLKQMIFKEWQKSPENPLNKA